jgi:hypothetical protein
MDARQIGLQTGRIEDERQRKTGWHGKLVGTQRLLTYQLIDGTAIQSRWRDVKGRAHQLTLS